MIIRAGRKKKVYKIKKTCATYQTNRKKERCDAKNTINKSHRCRSGCLSLTMNLTQHIKEETEIKPKAQERTKERPSWMKPPIDPQGNHRR
jgi:hypothetical protein